MEVTLSVKRFNPDSVQPTIYFQEYALEVDDSATVLDGLIKVREEIDGSLALRCSCRSAICGSCAMRINGQAMLACNTKLSNATTNAPNDPIVIEPAGNMEVVKDLVVDFAPFWDKVKSVEPWLQAEEEPPDREYIAPNEDMLKLAGVMACIMCGACVSDCTVLQVDDKFLGPAALAKAYRFVDDPRDNAAISRLNDLNDYGGMWDCTRCMQCVEVCPKDVDPMGRIIALRDQAMKEGYTKTYGARHATAFSNSIRHGGRINELWLTINTFGMFNIKKFIGLLPVAIRTQMNGKRPAIYDRPIPGIDHVRRIFKNAEDRQ